MSMAHRVSASLVTVALLVGAQVPSLAGAPAEAPGEPSVGASAQFRDTPAPSSRLHWGIAAGPVVEVATPGSREREIGLLAMPSVEMRLTSWFDYVVEGHAAGYLAPVTGAMAGVVPVGWRIHGRGRTQPFLSMGAGVTWTNLTGLYGLDRRRNYITQIGGGVRRFRATGSALSIEARLFHLSNMSSAPPNLGMEAVTVLVGYRRPLSR
jgi:hypothetical protein